MTSYQDKTFDERKEDHFWTYSERIFEAQCPYPWTRFGLNEDRDLPTWRLPDMVRKAPDYIVWHPTGPVFCEVQGTGKGAGDRLHKIKIDKFRALKRWNLEMRVTFWLWDNENKRYDWVDYPSLTLMVSRDQVQHGSFDNGQRPWYGFDVDQIHTLSERSAFKDQ